MLTDKTIEAVIQRWGVFPRVLKGKRTKRRTIPCKVCGGVYQHRVGGKRVCTGVITEVL